MTKFAPLACGFHAHSHFSLDGGSTVQKLVKRAKQLGRTAMNLTDHGNMNGLADLHMCCAKEEGIKAIHGIELYVINDQWFPSKVGKDNKQRQQHKHLTCHFLDQTAYAWFCGKSVDMERRAVTVFGERKQILYWHELLEIADHIVLGSGCLGSFVMSAVRDGNLELAERIYCELRSAVKPGRFFAEIFPHQLTETWQKPEYDKDKKKIIKSGYFKSNEICGHAPLDVMKSPNEFIISLATKYGDPIVCSEDCVEAGTFIRTPYGMKKIEHILPGEYVLTHKGRYRKVLKTRGVLSEKRKVEISMDGFNTLTLTEDHLVFSKKTLNQWSPFEKARQEKWIKSSDLKKGDFVFIPKSTHFGFNVVTKIDMLQYFHHNYRRLQTTQNSISYENRGKKIIIDRFIDLDEELCFIIGLFLGDGNAHNNLISFAFDTETYALMAPKIIKYCIKLHLSYDEKHEENHSIIRIINTAFAKFFRDSFYKHKEKSIPWWIWETNLKNKLKVIEGICWSDGGDRNGTETAFNGVTIGVNNIIIPSFVKEVMAQNNIYSSFSSRKTNGSTSLTHTVNVLREIASVCSLWGTPEERKVNKRYETQTGWWIRIENIGFCCSNNSFYDLEVEEDHSFATESIAVHNCHVSTPEEWSTQNIKMGRGADAWRFSIPYAMNDTDFWADHLKKQLGENLITDRFIEKMVDNSHRFVDLFQDYKFSTYKDKWILPTTEIVFKDQYKGLSNKQILKKMIVEFGRMPPKSNPRFKEYMDRLTYEVNVLSDNGQLDLLPYFFVLADLVKWAKANNRICQARGSAGGSLVAYLLGITVTDPIEWDLQFERFLTLGRLLAGTLPDIDVDFCVKDVVFQRLKEKYGDKLSKISINTLMKVKSSIRDVERVERGEVSDTTEAMCRKIPAIPQGIEPIKWLNGYEDKDTGVWIPGYIEDKSETANRLREYIKNEPKLWGEVQACLGIVRQKSCHACALILADDSVSKYTPLTIIGDELVTGFCPKGCEYKGLIKFDMLGVSTLEACRIAINSIFEQTGEKLEWKEFPHDPDVYEYIIGHKLLQGIFQIGTDTMRPYVLSLKPKNIKDLCNVIALVRPGTLDAPIKISDKETLTAADFFIQCEQKKRSPSYIHPDLKPILSSTNGINLYQEQTLRIFRDLGGMTYEQAEVTRRAIGKKIKELLAQELNKLKSYIKLSRKNWSDDQIEELAEMIIASSRYSFNKCFSGKEKLHRAIGKHRTLTISEMYKTMHDSSWAEQNDHEDLNNKYRRLGYGKAWSLNDDNRIRKNNIVDIRHEGRKYVFKITTEKNRSVTCTWNHKFPTPNGERKLFELIVGDELFVNDGYKQEYLIKYNLYKNGFKSNLPTKGQCGFQKKPVGNSVIFDQIKELKTRTLTKCEICGEVLKGRKEIHHNDGDRSNNNPSNLVLCCVSCHKKAHYAKGRTKQGEKGLFCATEKIISIEFMGLEDVFDIEMDDPFHTIVMESGIVASNSHAAACAVVAYNCMWLKYFYPLHFYRGLLTINNDDHDEIREILKEAGEIVLSPDVIKSHPTEWLIEGEKIRSPLTLIKGVGTVTATDLKKFISDGINGLELKPQKIKTKKESVDAGMA